MFMRCPKGHIERALFKDQHRQWCFLCGEVVIVTLLDDAEGLMAAAEAKKEYPEVRHMLADQALLEKLRASAPDFVERYERLERCIVSYV